MKRQRQRRWGKEGRKFQKKFQTNILFNRLKLYFQVYITVCKHWALWQQKYPTMQCRSNDNSPCAMSGFTLWHIKYMICIRLVLAHVTMVTSLGKGVLRKWRDTQPSTPPKLFIQIRLWQTEVQFSLVFQPLHSQMSTSGAIFLETPVKQWEGAQHIAASGMCNAL